MEHFYLGLLPEEAQHLRSRLKAGFYSRCGFYDPDYFHALNTTVEEYVSAPPAAAAAARSAPRGAWPENENFDFRPKT